MEENISMISFKFLLSLLISLSCLKTSFLTPPFGYALFYFKGVAPPAYTMGDIYKGIMPFVAIQVIGLILMVIFPSLITWLPSIFFGS